MSEVFVSGEAVEPGETTVSAGAVVFGGGRMGE